MELEKLTSLANLPFSENNQNLTLFSPDTQSNDMVTEESCVNPKISKELLISSQRDVPSHCTENFSIEMEMKNLLTYQTKDKIKIKKRKTSNSLELDPIIEQETNSDRNLPVPDPLNNFISDCNNLSNSLSKNSNFSINNVSENNFLQSHLLEDHSLGSIILENSGSKMIELKNISQLNQSEKNGVFLENHQTNQYDTYRKKKPNKKLIDQEYQGKKIRETRSMQKNIFVFLPEKKRRGCIKTKTDAFDTGNKFESSEKVNSKMNSDSIESHESDDEFCEQQYIDRNAPISYASLRSYSQLKKIMDLLPLFEWYDHTTQLNTMIPIKCMTQNCFWFMICCTYFPRMFLLNETSQTLIQKMKDSIHSIPNKCTLRINSQNLKQFKIASSKSNYKFEKLYHIIKEQINNLNYNCDNKIEMVSVKTEAPPYKSNYDYDDDFFLAKHNTDIIILLQDILAKFDHNSNSLESIHACAKKLSLEDHIKLLEYKLYLNSIELKKEEINLANRINASLISENVFSSSLKESDNPLIDLFSRVKDEQDYLISLETQKSSFIEKRACEDNLNEKDPSTKFKNSRKKQTSFLMLQENLENLDYLCQICNDGDFSDDDKIVFCSKCNISVHQKCYGLEIIPKGDWICLVCKNFGSDGKYLRCPLCPRRGGALKPCANLDLEKIEINNPEYYSYYVKCCQNGKPTIFHSESEENEYEQLSLDYDWHKIEDDEFTLEELQSEPIPSDPWVHMTCASWIPEVYFEETDGIQRATGLNEIDKKRFSKQCSLCLKKNAGACAMCAKSKCSEAFHPECARRSKLCMEMKPGEHSIFIIFCEKHTPSKIRRLLEQREKKAEDEIVKFAKSIKKFYTTYKFKLGSLNASAPNHVPRQIEKRNAKYIRQVIKKSKLADFEKKKSLLLGIYRHLITERANYQTSIDIEKTNKNFMTVKKVNFPTKLLTSPILSKSHNLFQNPSSSEKPFDYNIYYTNIKKMLDLEGLKEIFGDDNECDSMKIEQKNDLNKKLFKKKQYKTKNKKSKQSSSIKDTNLYCICQQMYEDGELMIACECCDMWYHPKCLQLDESLDWENEKFICIKCRGGKKLYEDENMLGKHEPLESLSEEENTLNFENKTEKKLKRENVEQSNINNNKERMEEPKNLITFEAMHLNPDSNSPSKET